MVRQISSRVVLSRNAPKYQSGFSKYPLGRYRDRESLVNAMGLPNRGAAAAARSMEKLIRTTPFLVSVWGEHADEVWTATLLLDKLALFTTEVYQKGREALISRQQHEMLELSTPVVQLWDNVLALPLIGTLDSARTQVVMENLLHKIVDTGAAIAIIDITGVPTVDTLVAQHLLKTVAAARLMGADCIISGIRPQIAQTIVHLGVELASVVTKATLADAFAIALQKTGATIGKPAGR